MRRPHFPASTCLPSWPPPDRRISYIRSSIPWKTSDMKRVSPEVWHFSDLWTSDLTCPCATSTSRIIAPHPPNICYADNTWHTTPPPASFFSLLTSSIFKRMYLLPSSLTLTRRQHRTSSLLPFLLSRCGIILFYSQMFGCYIMRHVLGGNSPLTYMTTVCMSTAGDIKVLAACALVLSPTRPIFFSPVTMKYFCYIDKQERRLGTTENRASMMPELTT